MKALSWSDYLCPPAIPTMLSQEEQGYLYALGRSVWPGSGHVVEMGPWLGGSTACLAAGMSENPDRGGWNLHTFDSFVWDGFMARPGAPRLEPGDSFEPAFRANIAPWESLVRVHTARLPDEITASDRDADTYRGRVSERIPLVTWPADGPVDILFIDGAKSWTGLRHLLIEFAEALPEGARIVFQDFKYWGSYWVPAIAEFFHDHLQIEHVLRHNTVTFQVIRPLTRSAARTLPSWDELTAGAVRHLIDGAAKRLEGAGDPLGSRIVALGNVRMFIHKGDAAAAEEVFRRIEPSWPLTGDDGNLSGAREFLASQTGSRICPLPRTRLRNALRHGRGLVARLRGA